jgi:F-type H+-transporting ATPase subunit delta
MKVKKFGKKKEAQKIARMAFKQSFSNGVISENKVRAWLRAIIKARPRDLISVLKVYQTLIYNQLKKESVLIESAAPLEVNVRNKLIDRLESVYGKRLQTYFEVNPDLIGGVRLVSGDCVWDGSVKGSLDSLSDEVSAR